MTDKTHFETIDEYIQAQPAEVQESLQKLRQVIAKAAPEASETISYNLPTFKQNDKYVVYFSAWKDHISLYPTPSHNEVLRDELAPYMSGKGTLKFPLEKPIPYELVEKLTVALLEENAQRA
jgi:uncharacterized protein YdhG (YjbR/CyaY superfamily)